MIQLATKVGGFEVSRRDHSDLQFENFQWLAAHIAGVQSAEVFVLKELVNSDKLRLDRSAMEQYVIPIVSDSGIPLGQLVLFDESPIYLDEAKKEAIDKICMQIVELLELNGEYLMLQNHADDMKDAVEEMKDRLMANEHFAIMGRLLPEISHEINSPLGGINASMDLVDISFLDQLRTIFSTMDHASQLLFEEMVEQGANPVEDISSSNCRKMRRAIASKLEEWNVESCDDLAELLVDMNIYDPQPYKALLLRADAEDILDVAFDLVNQQQAMKNMRTAIKRATKTVRTLKAYSNNAMVDTPDPASLICSVEDALTIFQGQLKHNINLTKTFYEEKIEVLMPQIDLVKIWFHLIQNSIQAMDGTGDLDISIKKSSNDVLVAFKDSGKGLPDKELCNLMSGTSKKFKGLNIVHKVVKQYGGKIGLETGNKGTTIQIHIPMIQEMKVV